MGWVNKVRWVKALGKQSFIRNSNPCRTDTAYTHNSINHYRVGSCTISAKILSACLCKRTITSLSKRKVLEQHHWHQGIYTQTTHPNHPPKQSSSVTWKLHHILTAQLLLCGLDLYIILLTYSLNRVLRLFIWRYRSARKKIKHWELSESLIWTSVPPIRFVRQLIHSIMVPQGLLGLVLPVWELLWTWNINLDLPSPTAYP